MKTLNLLPVFNGDYVETIEATEVVNQFSWEVKSSPIRLASGEPVPGYKAIQRDDNGLILNVCKDSYTPTTNERFSEFVYRLSQLTGYQVESFNEFREGRKVLAFLKADKLNINGWDYSNYLAVGNAHDGTNALFVAQTNVMIRCQNQFSTLSERGLKAFHTISNNAQIRQIENSIHEFYSLQQNFVENMKQLSGHKADQVRIEHFVKNMLDIEPNVTIENASEFLSGRKLNMAGDLLDNIQIELSDIGSNDLALFNGVTRWTTHTRKQTNSTFGNLFGSNADYNRKALNFLLN